MSIIDDKKLQKGLIITDDLAIDPILDFNLYRNSIVIIVKESFPKFTIGILGEWGTGKTTLMNSIDQMLQNDEDIVIARFESWRYEREEQFALIPLLKTIAFALPDTEKYLYLKQRLKRGAIGFLKKTPDILSSFLSTYLGNETGKITKAMFDSFKKEFDTKVDLLAEVDKDTLYFEGFEDIRKEIEKLRQENSSFRIIVFIDDLDRCSPKKALEVLESIKVFLGMEGFIYILGLSPDIISKLIDIEYKESGIKGEHYIKKIIQIPINLPRWNSLDIKKLLADLVKNELINKKYQEIITENMDLISIAIENNPREIKRFLNNFIVTYEIFSNDKDKDIKAVELLTLQAIQIRWNSFYNIIINSDDQFLNELKVFSLMEEENRKKILDANENEYKEHSIRVRKILRKYNEDIELWNFLDKSINVLVDINNWDNYRRTTEISIIPSVITRHNETVPHFDSLESSPHP